MTAANPAFRRDSWIIIALGFAQGLAIYGLIHVGKGVDAWADSHPWFSAALWGWVLFLPPTAQWLIRHYRQRSYWAMLGLVAVAAPLICWEPARALVPQGSRGFGEALFAGGTLAWAAAISLASTALSSGLRDYPNLFRLTCRTVLLPSGALLFTLIFTALLWLCGALFELIHINFVKRLFELDWLMWPVRGIVFGVATAILIERPMLVDGVRRACTAIASALLPVVVVIHLLFLIGLLFVGLEPLWATRHATPLVMTLMVAFLILLNGAHEEGTKLEGLARPIAGLIRIAILLSPIYMAIAAYSLSLRVVQYGWSPDRAISGCIIGFVSAVVLTYFAAAVRRPFLAIPRLATPNIIALIVLIALGVAANSPLLSPQRIAASSQEARILAGKVAPDRIDWATLAFDLGRYGKDAVTRLASIKDVAGAEDIRNGAAKALAAESRYALREETERARAQDFVMVPGNGPLPDGLLDALHADSRRTLPPLSCADQCKLAAIDLNRDGEAEIVVLSGYFPVYGRQSGNWLRLGRLTGALAIDDVEVITQFSQGKAQAIVPEWQDVTVAGRQLRLQLEP